MGRGAELALLRGLVADVAAGRGRAVFVEGEPGIGKSALLAAGLAEAWSQGCDVLQAAADELGQRFPLQVMLECLGVDVRSADPRRAEIARALRGERSDPIPVTAVGAGTGDPVVAAVERLLALVDELCAVAPVVLVIDDLQWADATSLLVWHRLALAVDQLPLLLAGAARPVPRRPELAPLRRGLASRDGVLISLGPLSTDDVSALVGALVGAPPGPWLRQRTERAAGNPLYVREMVDTLLREDAVRIEDGRAEPAGPESAVRAPASLAGAIADRLGFLSADAVSVLRMAALLGSEFSVAEFAVVAGRQPTDLLPVIDDAAAAGVLDASGPRLRFRHALIRQALYEAVPMAMRQALHRQAAEALTAAGAPVDRVAQQLLPVVDSGDSWMLGWLAEAAQTLIYRAPQIAADLLERAVGNGPGRRAAAGGAGGIAGHGRVPAGPARPAGVAHPAGAGQGARPRAGRRDDLAARLHVDAPEALRRGDRGGAPGARRLCPRRCRAGAHVRVGGPGAGQLGPLRGRGCRHPAGGGRGCPGRRPVRHRLHHAHRVGAVRPETRHGQVPGVHRPRPGRDWGRPADRRPARAAAVQPDVRARVSGPGDRGGRRPARGQGLRRADRNGSDRIGNIQVASAEHFYLSGRWDDAQAELESITEMPETQFSPLWRHGLAAVIAAHRDRPDSAAAHLRVVRDRELTPDVRRNAEYVIMARAVVAERAGRPADAVAVLAPTLRPDYAEHMTNRLVAEGRSNPDIGAALFLSRRTVQTHVSHIMVKLGVRSRTEVAREAGLHPAPHAARHPGDRHAADRGSLA